LLFVAIVFQGTSFAQLESNHWYFGLGAGVNFDNYQISATTSSVSSNGNGAATMSNSDGELLFYYGRDPSNQEKRIYNRHHMAMPNSVGLLDDIGSEQSAVTIPTPDTTDNRYYIFVTDVANAHTSSNENGLYYHVVDMDLDSGLGDVIDSAKNLVLFGDSTSEKITATKHWNGEDYWVTIQQCASSKFHSFRVTQNGVDQNPVTSIVGPITDNYGRCSGSLRFSNRSDLLVDVRGDQIVLMRFDNSSGELSQPILLSDLPNLSFGTEFSPDGTKMYVGGPWQLDISVYDSATIMNSAIFLPNVDPSSPTLVRGLQMGLDGKIYGINWGFTQTGYLSVINFPNEAGGACGYQDSAVFLQGRNGIEILPNFPSSFFLLDFAPKGFCLGDTTFFDINFHFIDSVLWNFGDPGSGAANTSTLVDAWHIYDEPGSYTVTLIAQNGAKTDTVTRTITIKAPPEIDLGPDREFCASSGSSTTLSLGGKKGTYLWSDGSTDSTLTVSQSGVYALTFTDECGTDEDSVEVFASAPLSVSLPPDTSLCADSFEITPTVSNSHRLTKYTWSSGDTTLNFTTARDTTGEHTKLLTFTAGNTCGKDSASIAVTFLAQPDGFLPNDSIYCLDDPFFLLNKQSAGISYLWSNGNTGPQLRISESGTYWLQSASVCDTLIDSFNITFNGEPKVDIGNDTFICPEVEVRFFNRIPGSQLPGTQSYLWSTGSTDSALITALDSSQILTVNATYDQCTVRDSIRVIVQNDCPQRCVPNIANFITPNGDGINDQLKINMTCRATDLNFSIYNRWGQLLYQSQSQTPSWDGSVNGQLASDGTYYYVLTYQDEAGEQRRYQGSLTVVR
jgi:gliding motility-associated-like protein